MINIVLFNPEIPQNTGNIMRTCAATNVKLHLIKPLGFLLDKKNIRRSAANYLEQTDYEVYEDFEDFKNKNQGDYYFITRYGEKTHSDFKYVLNDDIYFILGSESKGLPKELLEDNINKCIRLPMNENVRSLNLSNVASIIIYEALRQNNYNGLSKTEPEIFKGKDYLKK